MIRLKSQKSFLPFFTLNTVVESKNHMIGSLFLTYWKSWVESKRLDLLPSTKTLKRVFSPSHVFVRVSILSKLSEVLRDRPNSLPFLSRSLRTSDFRQNTYTYWRLRSVFLIFSSNKDIYVSKCFVTFRCSLCFLVLLYCDIFLVLFGSHCLMFIDLLSLNGSVLSFIIRVSSSYYMFSYLHICFTLFTMYSF